MEIRVDELASALGAEYVGNGACRVKRAAEPGSAGPQDLALAMDARYGEALAGGKARAAVLWPGADWRGLGLEAAIFVSRPRLALAGITAAFAHQPEVAPGIHPTAVIDPSAEIGSNVAIGPFCVIGARAHIGDGARLIGQVTVAEDARLGRDAVLFNGVRIGAHVVIGDRFIAHYNVVVGSDGFSFVTPEPSRVEEVRASILRSPTAPGMAGSGSDAAGDGADARAGSGGQSHVRIASNGAVRIGDDVEIGACATVDKGTIADTVIGSGTKIDDHVHVGHNVRVGRDCLLCGQSAIAGSTRLGDRVVLGGQAGVADHLVIGNDVIAAGGTGILSNVPAGRVMMGYPAMPMTRNIESYKALRRLPRLLARLDALHKRLSGSSADEG